MRNISITQFVTVHLFLLPSKDLENCVLIFTNQKCNGENYFCVILAITTALSKHLCFFN